LNLIMLEGVSTFAATHGYHVHLLISRHEHPLEEVRQQILQENSFDGIIFTGYRSLVPQDAAKLVRRMKTGGVTAVTIDETLGAAGLPMVAVNLEPAVLQAVQRLKALHCRRAAYIGLMHQVAHERIARCDLFRNALEQAGIDLPEQSILRTHREIDGYRHTLELLRRGPLPDCIIYGSDHIAMAGLEALGDNGIQAPDEVRVLGVDHAPYAAESPVELASLDQRYFDRGQTLAKVLLDQINHPNKSVPSRTELDARFVDGASLGAAGRTGSMQPRLERSLETC
jgi:DNA-binding LacI/PurR family transcriptional regulator